MPYQHCTAPFISEVQSGKFQAVLEVPIDTGWKKIISETLTTNASEFLSLLDLHWNFVKKIFHHNNKDIIYISHNSFPEKL